MVLYQAMSGETEGPALSGMAGIDISTVRPGDALEPGGLPTEAALVVSRDPNRAWNGAMLAGSAVLAAATWGVQTLGYRYGANLSGFLKNVADSGGHPMFGVVGASIGRFQPGARLKETKLGSLIDRLAAKSTRLKAAAIGLSATVAIDLTAEETQDRLFYAHQPQFYSPERIGENATDLKFALGGLGVALLVSNRDKLPAFPWNRTARQSSK